MVVNFQCMHDWMYDSFETLVGKYNLDTLLKLVVFSYFKFHESKLYVSVDRISAKCYLLSFFFCCCFTQQTACRFEELAEKWFYDCTKLYKIVQLISNLLNCYKCKHYFMNLYQMLVYICNDLVIWKEIGYRKTQILARF